VVQTDYIGDWSAAGWIVIVLDDDNACLIRYDHCSCYGTWDGGVGEDKNGQPDWDWQGSVAELIEFAQEMRDPDMPDRKLGEDDYGANDLREVYTEFLKWAAEKGHMTA